jgi:hypothetical protein
VYEAVGRGGFAKDSLVRNNAPPQISETTPLENRNNLAIVHQSTILSDCLSNRILCFIKLLYLAKTQNIVG